MIERETALEQVLRFKHYTGFPGDGRQADQDELIAAFQEASADDGQARAIGDWLLRSRPAPDCRFCPVPAEVYSAAPITQAQIKQPDEWQPQRKPGDEPFHGLIDLVDDRLLDLLRRRTQSARTHAERESAKRLVSSIEVRRKQHRATSEEEPSPEVLDSLDDRLLSDLRERAERGGTPAQREAAQRLLRAWEARQSHMATGSLS